MCGIAGIVSPGRPLSEDMVPVVRRFCRALAHRGPDGEGVLERPNAVLGHRRLAVIDLSLAAQQPMSNEKGRTWVVFNGEIYNHRPIRADLEKHGWRFRSSSDTEVLVNGYEQWGMQGLLPRLRGMFAFALWDEAQRTLWLARDRLGVKPLFYIDEGGTVVFSSEIRPLLDRRPATVDRIDRTALDCYLAFGCVPPDRAIVEGIKKVPPATAIAFCANGQSPSVWRYWRLPEDTVSGRRVLEIRSGLASMIRDAVSIRLQSDVPLGCFLSGGIDSGLVTAMAAGAMDRSLATLTVAFGLDGGDDDETGLAGLVAERYGTVHHELRIGSSEVAELPQLVRMVGEPFADSSLLPTAAVCRAARRTVTVALTGDGGDEVFAGYHHIAASHWGDLARRAVGRRACQSASQRLLGWGPKGSLHRLGTLFQYGATSVVDLYAEQAAVFNSAARASLYRPGWFDAGNDATARDIIAARVGELPDLPLADAYARLDLGFRLPGRYLVKVDIASSACGLECRSPFLDQDLIEVVLRLPAAVLLRRGRQKGLLRKLAADFLPRPVVRARKRGFAPNVNVWLRGEGRSLLERLRPFEIGNDGGPLHPEALDRLLGDYLAGNSGLGEKIWSVLCLELWWRTFVTGTINSGIAWGAE